MNTYVLIHGAGDVGWYWHLVETELRDRGHDVIAPDLPCDDDSANLDDYADTVITAICDRTDLVIVGQSFGAYTATLVADRTPAKSLVLVAGMIPAAGESAGEWFSTTGCSEAVRRQAERDNGLTGNDDPRISFYHDVPAPLVDEALSRERDQSATPMETPWPLQTWPDVPTRFILCTQDRTFPATFFRQLVADRLPAVAPREIDASHCVALSRPAELAAVLNDRA